jgi:hypothetical protein
VKGVTGSKVGWRDGPADACWLDAWDRRGRSEAFDAFADCAPNRVGFRARKESV